MFPVEEKMSEISAALAANRALVLSSPPGSGKSTCVPAALLDAPWLEGKKIVMLEPRRLAARALAGYIAKRRGEAPGETVGYSVRLERCVSKKTRLEIVTEGLLAQRLVSDPELADTGLLVFDEFHERALSCDLAFALALDVKKALREDLRILVMSATLDMETVADHFKTHLGAVETIRADGRLFPVETTYLGDVSLSSAVCRALAETSGDVLCFLPGESEIRRAEATLLATLDPDAVAILPLYGALAKEEQSRVFLSFAPRRKVILATSIAETSLTIEGVTAVVDSGLMRVARFSPGTGMTGLRTLPLTRDRAEQRRGRAGRVASGICYRLWSEAENASRPAKAAPEIMDADLSSLVLSSASWGACRREDLPWLTLPPKGAWDQAVELLTRLGALDARGALTEKGRTMARLPMHPRLANMCLLGGEEAAFLAATLEEARPSRETDIRQMPRSSRVETLARRFERLVARKAPRALSTGATLALAYPDRIGKNRGNGTFQMVSGRGAFLDRGDALAREMFLVCCELDDRAGDARIYRACPIMEEEIEALFGDQILEERLCTWDRAAERVKCVMRRHLGAMTLSEVNSGVTDGAFDDEIACALVEGVRQKGVENMPSWTNEMRQVRARLAFLSKVFGEEAWPRPTDERILGALAPFVGGMRKWRDLEKLNLGLVFDAMMAEAGHDRRELERLAPARMEVPSGSHMMIHYEGDEPTVEVRLQECFGLMETPKVAEGRVPIVMTLLSPAQRPIQVTKDLKGFWTGAYQLVRKDMRGRYPKHNWPEDPLTAVATRRTLKRQ